MIKNLPFAQTTTAKNKQRRRNISPTKRNKLLTRSVMDLPTTDPGSDFLEYYTTDDECETDYDTEGNAVKTSLPRVKKILRGDMRKANSASYEMMPPELIITKVKNIIILLNLIKMFLSRRFLMTINKLV